MTILDIFRLLETLSYCCFYLLSFTISRNNGDTTDASFSGTVSTTDVDNTTVIMKWAGYGECDTVGEPYGVRVLRWIMLV